MDFLKSAMERVKPQVERLIRRELDKMTETNANASANIHVLVDETLGGIKREYMEIDREAEVGEKIIIVDADVREEKPYSDGDIFDIENSGSSCVRTTCDRYLLNEEYRVLEPTDIVHIDGGRYGLTDRKAEVGEKVIIVALDPGLATESDLGKVTTVTKLCSEDDIETAKLGWVKRSEYRVLVPVEAEADEPQPADLIDVVSNLATRVAELERENKKLHAALTEDMKIRSENTRRYLALQDEIDTLHKDNRTLGEELERLKETPKNEACAPIDAPLVFVQRKIGDVFDVYQDGKRLRGIKRIRIDAAMGEVTTHDIEFVSGATEEESP